MNIVTLSYKSTNYYVLADKNPILLIDAGWPGTMPKFQHESKRMGIALEKIPYLLITHYHPDHAGLAQDLKQMGLKMIVLETQVSSIPLLRGQMKPEDRYVEIDRKGSIDLMLANSRAFLAGIGIQGQIIATPGHSDDSVSLVLDDGSAFVGDLPHPMILGESDPLVSASWEALRAAGAKRMYGAHTPVWMLT